MSPADQAELGELKQRAEATRPVCVTDQECAVLWAKVRRYILDHSGFRLQTVTDSYLETYNTRDTAETARWWQASKEPRAGGGWVIVLDTGCNNFLSCGPFGNTNAVIQANQALSAP